MALVKNLQHTRVFVSVGNGAPQTGDDTSQTARFEESEFDRESIAWTAAARKAGVSVHFDQLAGTHTTRIWFAGLDGMLAWNPFAPVPQKPSKWTFSTVESAGTAWNYRFASPSYLPPAQVDQFTLSNGVFEARGGGILSITQPNGKTVTGHVPFAIRNGHVVELHGVSGPKLASGYSGIMPFFSIKATPRTVGLTQPVTVSFKTVQRLPRGYRYEVAAVTFSSSCFAVAGKAVTAPAKGKVVKVPVDPAKDAASLPPGVASAYGLPPSSGTQTSWCAGGTGFAVVMAVKGKQLIGYLLGSTTFGV